MSGVYIGGIEMPKTYPLTVTIYPDGQVVSETVGAKDIHGHATYVPPHGRCIDADELEYEEAYLNGHYELGDVEIVTREDIESAPAILPAEES